MSLHKSSRWADEAKSCIDSIIESYEEAEKESTESIEDLQEQLADIKAELCAANEELAALRSTVTSMSSPDDPSSPFNR